MGPRPYLEDSSEREIVHDAARSIVQIAYGIVHEERFEQHFVVLPLLLAGTVLDETASQEHIQQLLRRQAARSLGSNTAATLRLLQAVHEQQQQQLRQESSSAASRSIDLFGVIESTGINVIHFGL